MAGVRTVEVVANVASGSVGRTAPAEIQKILAAYGASAHVWTPEPQDLVSCLRAAVDAAPDLLIVLAGDGTARTAAEIAGPDGPLIAPLPGGTMNMLPHAIYGQRSWQAALSIALEQGYEQPIGGGEVDGHSFLVAAILGSPSRVAGMPWADQTRATRNFDTSTPGASRQSPVSAWKPRRKASAVSLTSSAAASSAASSLFMTREVSGHMKISASAFSRGPASRM